MELAQHIEEAVQIAQSVLRAWARASMGEQLRAARDVSQRHLAEFAGLHQSVVCRIENGGDTNWRTWRRLFNALGYELVLTPLSVSEEAADLLKEETWRRRERIEAGRMSRWPTRL
jgi:transcriptional regulator with XRE-family HTH domain